MLRTIAFICVWSLGIGVGMTRYAEDLQYEIRCEEFAESKSIISKEVDMLKREEGSSVRATNFKETYDDGYAISCDIVGYYFDWSDEEECLIGDYRKIETVTVSYDDDGLCKILYEY